MITLVESYVTSQNLISHIKRHLRYHICLWLQNKTIVEDLVVVDLVAVEEVADEAAMVEAEVVLVETGEVDLIVVQDVETILIVETDTHEVIVQVNLGTEGTLLHEAAEVMHEVTREINSFFSYVTFIFVIVL